MTIDTGMTLDQARQRIPADPPPDHWVGTLARLDTVLSSATSGRISVVATSPGGRPIHRVDYGVPEPRKPQANFNSAVGARNADAYLDKAHRDRPVLLLIGPVHGQETEGLTGLASLIALLETGTDLAGRHHPRLLELARAARLIVVPAPNPDGLARFEPQALVGMAHEDLRFWGQGTRRDNTYWNWPDCKARHPMRGDVGFLGCYFNDNGVNPMHDEFTAPMGPEAEALMGLARDNAPDLTVSLHACGSPPMLLRPAYVPLTVQDEVRTIAEHLNNALSARGLPPGALPAVSAENREPPAPFNLVSALYHASGTTAITFECPHGLAGKRFCQVGHEEILDIQLCLYETLLSCLSGKDGS